MRSVVVLALLAFGCGKEIGDPCAIGADCDPNGQRLCDLSQNEGYCTIEGCDFSTCPEEAACIRFFTGQFENKECASNADCTFDELCNLNNKCVPRNAEVRFCMKQCDTDEDCRDGYECRNIMLMKAHGGEPVLEGGARPDESSPKFCAIAPS